LTISLNYFRPSLRFLTHLFDNSFAYVNIGNFLTTNIVELLTQCRIATTHNQDIIWKRERLITTLNVAFSLQRQWTISHVTS